MVVVNTFTDVFSIAIEVFLVVGSIVAEILGAMTIRSEYKVYKVGWIVNRV